MKPEILLTICARGGSKGIPGKNIRPLNGKPLIVYTIDQALRWKQPKDLWVSTDSAEIAGVVESRGIVVPKLRPAALAQDDTPKLEVLRHAVSEAESLYNKTYDIIVDLDVTSPIRTEEDLKECLDKFAKYKPKSLFSVVKARKNPYFNQVESTDNEFVKLVKDAGATVVARQNAPKVFDMNASIYFYDRNYLMDEDNMSPISDRSVVHEMSDKAGLDIDDETDFKFVEFLVSSKVIQI